MKRLTLAVALVSAFAADAYACIITVEPDNFLDGQDISSITPGVILQRESGNPVYAYDTDDPNYASTGTQVFGYVDGFGPEPFWDERHVFRATFTGLTEFVSIDVVNNDESSDGDSAYMEIFGASGWLATLFTGSITFPGFQTLAYRSSSADISYIRMSSVDGGDFNLDRFQFDIPAPATLALMGAGMLGLLSRRRKPGPLRASS